MAWGSVLALAVLALAVWLVILRKVLYRHTYLAGIDSTLASADNDTAAGLRTTIHCVFTLKQNITAAAFRDLLVTKHLRHRRLKQRLVQRNWLWHYWQDVGDSFDLSQHFFVHDRGVATQDDLEAFVSRHLTTPLHPHRPLWEFHLVRNYGPARDQSVVLFRVHHALGDGVALMRIALTVFESKPAPIQTAAAAAAAAAGAFAQPEAEAGGVRQRGGAGARAHPNPSPSPPLLSPSPSPSLLAAPQSPASAPLSPGVSADDSKTGLRSAAAEVDTKAEAAGGGGGGEEKAKKRSHHGKHKNRVNYCKLLTGVLSATYKLLVLPPDPVSPLKSDTNMDANTKINVRWSKQPIPLATLKAVSKQSGASINDILTSCGSGAIGTFLDARDAAAARDDAANDDDNAVVTRSGSGGVRAAAAKAVADIQAVLWVSLRGLDLTLRKVDFSNRLGTVYLRLPLALRDPLERLRSIQRQTAALIASPEAFVSYAIMSLVGCLPPVLTRAIWFGSAFKVTLSMSNLPGPHSPLSFAGGDVERFVFFVPPVRTIGHFLCILSYADTVVCGLACDERLVRDPAPLVHHFHAEVDRLVAASNAAAAAAKS